MGNEKDIFTSINSYNKKIDRSLNRTKQRLTEYEDETKLSHYGYWSKGYYNGIESALEDIAGELDDILKCHIDYNKLLDEWHDNIAANADENLEKSNEFEVGSIDYIKYKSFADGLYTALAMLSIEERKYTREIQKRIKS